jgi:hypothetical protein
LLLQHGSIKCFPDLQNKDLTDMLPEVEDFTINELLPALSKGSPDERKRKEIAAK